MGLWWLGNIVLLFVVIPVVVLLLRVVLRSAEDIGRHTGTILEHGVNVAADLEAVPALLTTRDLVKKVGAGVGKYGAALDVIIPNP
jgi:hypothetical protein